MPVRQQFFRATQLFLAGATLLLTACGGGGSSGGAAASGAQVSGGGIAVVPPAFTANNAIDAAYFSNSFEITETASSSMGYIKNYLTSTGTGGRDLFSINGVSYQLDTGTYSGNGIMINGSQLSFTDKWLTSASAYTSIKNEANGGGYIYRYINDDLLKIDNIQEMDISSQPFSSWMSASNLGSVSGFFPLGSKVYTARLTSLSDMYVSSGVSSFLSGTLDASYFYRRYPNLTSRLCLPSASKTQAIVFTSATTATEYSMANSNCFGTTLASNIVISHTINLLRKGDYWIFDFNNTIQVADFEVLIFGARGLSNQRFVLMAKQPNVGSGGEFQDVFYFPAGSTGTQFTAAGERFNKVAANAILLAAGKPLIP